ncbi:uncharacterized protein BO87DRAFT_134551 [Aspergillus neoniger CBS 115656]|uniref:Uncharacterized protein n=1 Tax=Aspergillus neoniger (strain CBS 115656) TaxID=1448310 RepID=A0A318Z5B7_ASPNB|nr:hypothetical protein BO87DRAFT_134551 [Aspergillus neoniger CBS 115656]PYH38900.1 hypothetical protein BO87DRAFT_134551 [Aspergillus neoniger CBS 115656]
MAPNGCTIRIHCSAISQPRQVQLGTSHISRHRYCILCGILCMLLLGWSAWRSGTMGNGFEVVSDEMVQGARF